MSDQTYVFNSIEVKKTGREAKQQGTRSTTRGRIGTIALLVEITPVDPEEGTWKKWVKPVELFEITEKKE